MIGGTPRTAVRSTAVPSGMLILADDDVIVHGNDVIVHGDAKRACDVDDFFIIRMLACDSVGITHREPVPS
jgi:hypothetical protein